MDAPRVALVGDKGNHNEPAHPRIDALMTQLNVDASWVSTINITGQHNLTEYDAIWLVPGAPYKNQAGVYAAVRHARQADIPFLGTCGGFWSALLEYADAVLCLPDAQCAVRAPEKMMHLIEPLSCSFNGDRVAIHLEAQCLLAEIYGSERADEVLQCSYALAEDFVTRASTGGLQMCAWDPAGAPRGLWIPQQRFFLALLFQPELNENAAQHPVISAFLNAAWALADRDSQGSFA